MDEHKLLHSEPSSCALGPNASVEPPGQSVTRCVFPSDLGLCLQPHDSLVLDAGVGVLHGSLVILAEQVLVTQTCMYTHTHTHTTGHRHGHTLTSSLTYYHDVLTYH